jgi:hypothetical protein
LEMRANVRYLHTPQTLRTGRVGRQFVATHRNHHNRLLPAADVAIIPAGARERDKSLIHTPVARGGAHER